MSVCRSEMTSSGSQFSEVWAVGEAMLPEAEVKPVVEACTETVGGSGRFSARTLCNKEGKGLTWWLANPALRARGRWQVASQETVPQKDIRMRMRAAVKFIGLLAG